MDSQTLETSCRICLEEGASLPIFDKNETEENSVHSKLTLCFHEKIEDMPGYPQYICITCNNIINIIYDFINKFKETCTLLETRISSIKKECYSALSDIGGCELQIKFESDSKIDDNLEKTENLVELTKPLQLKITRNKTRKESIQRSQPKRKKIKPGNGTNKIASSILEGRFSWNGEKWCPNQETKLQQKCNGNHIENKGENRLDEIKIKSKSEASKLCDLCGIVFETREKLAGHKKKVHFKNRVQCSECPKMYVSYYYLKRHMKRAHENKRDFICSTCGKGFAFIGELKNHFKNVHNKHLKPKKIFSCKFCNKTYKCPKSVVVHERSVHTGLRPAICDDCGKSFSHLDYLKEHMRLHTGETPFKCPICGRGYAQSCNMKSHLRIHRLSEVDALTLSKMRPSYIKLLKD